MVLERGKFYCNYKFDKKRNNSCTKKSNLKTQRKLSNTFNFERNKQTNCKPIFVTPVKHPTGWKTVYCFFEPVFKMKLYYIDSDCSPKKILHFPSFFASKCLWSGKPFRDEKNLCMYVCMYIMKL